MIYLSEDPTYLAGGLFLLAGLFAVALKVTQQAKYLVRAVIAVALALVVIVVEWVWVTDNERIENVVYALRAAVLKSDVGGVLALLAPDVLYSRGPAALSPDETRGLIRSRVGDIRLEFARISQLRTSVGQHTRRGVAEFQVFSRGGLKNSSDAAGLYDNDQLVPWLPRNCSGNLENPTNYSGLAADGCPDARRTDIV